jgi:hypothetical protein
MSYACPTSLCNARHQTDGLDSQVLGPNSHSVSRKSVSESISQSTSQPTSQEVGVWIV